MAQIELELLAETKKATKSIQGFQRETSKSLNTVKLGFAAVGAAAATAIGYLAGRQLLSAISSVTEAASIQEDAVNELNTALKISGKYSEETSKSMQDFASSLQGATKFGDEVILQNAALIQSLGGLEEDGLKQATAAAVDLSAALGIDLRSAATLVGKAAAGEVSSFSRYGVIIEKGADNAQTFTNALTALNTKFGGAAAAQIKTYSGATLQLSNVFGDLLEEIGFLITKNPTVVNGVKFITAGLQDLIKLVKKNSGVIAETITSGFIALIDLVPFVLKGFSFILKGFNYLQIASLGTTSAIAEFLGVFLEFKVVQKILNSVVDYFQAFIGIIVKEIEYALRLISKIPGVGDLVGDATKSVKELGDALLGSLGEDVIDYDGTKKHLQDIGQSSLKAASDMDEFVTKVDGGLVVLANGAKKVADKIKAVGSSVATANSEAAKTATEGGVFSSFIKASGTFFESTQKDIEGTFDRIKKGFDDLDFKDFIGGQAKLLTTAVGGKAGAKKLISGLGATAANALVPGAGAVAGPLLDALSAGPEQVKAMIKEFATAIPDIAVDIITALVEGMPVLIDALLTELIDNGGLERIIISLVGAMPRLAYHFVLGFTVGLIQRIPLIAQRAASEIGVGLTAVFGDMDWAAFGNTIAEGFNPAKIGKGISDTLDELFTWPAIPTPDLEIPTPSWLDSLIDAIEAADPSNFGKGGTLEKLFSGNIVGATKDTFDSAKKRLGLASGGIVPGGHPNDTYPANLTSGELVVPTRTTDSLFSLIENLADDRPASEKQDTEQNLTVNLTIGQDELATAILNLNRQGFRLA